MSRRRILLIGATGVFGGRLAEHLGRFEGTELIVTARDATRAADLAKNLRDKKVNIEIGSVALDHRNNLEERIHQVEPWLVVDASGPFQDAGYQVAKAALKTGAHVVDLADARQYLKGYQYALDSLARSSGLSAVAGASSTPALSSAVVARLVKGWRRIDTIDICIAPAGRSEVGKAVIAAMLSYAGKPVPQWKDGRLTETIAWAGSGSVDIPGLGKRNVLPVETIDAELLGERYNVTDRVGFSAGLESPVEQFGIKLLARLRKAGWAGDLNFLTPFLLAARRLTRIPTSKSGGMLVEVAGLDIEGSPCTSRWSLVAKNDHGPYVPVMATAAIIRKLLANSLTAGAQLASDVLALGVIEAEMRPYEISTIIEHR